MNVYCFMFIIYYMNIIYYMFIIYNICDCIQELPKIPMLPSQRTTLTFLLV